MNEETAITAMIPAFNFRALPLETSAIKGYWRFPLLLGLNSVDPSDTDGGEEGSPVTMFQMTNYTKHINSINLERNSVLPG